MHRVRIVLLLALVLLVGVLVAGCGPVSRANAWSHAEKADRLNNEGRYDEAIEECTKAIELAPDLAGAYCSRARSYNAKGQYDLAIADCNKTIELDPNCAQIGNSGEAYYNRGYAYKLQGKKAEAIADFETFIRLTHNPQEIEMARQQIEELSK